MFLKILTVISTAILVTEIRWAIGGGAPNWFMVFIPMIYIVFNYWIDVIVDVFLRNHKEEIQKIIEEVRKEDEEKK